MFMCLADEVRTHTYTAVNFDLIFFGKKTALVFFQGKKTALAHSPS